MRVLFLYDQLPGKLYRCGLENIYVSSKFSNIGIKINIYVHVFNRTGGCCIPSSLLKYEVKSRQDNIGVLDTVKAAIICGDTECEDFLDLSFYDRNTVHFFTTSGASLKWFENYQLVYSKYMS